MEINTLTTVLITIASVGTLGTLVYLVSSVRSLKDRVETLALEMVDFHTYVDNKEVEQARNHDRFSDDVDIRFDRVHRKVGKNQDEIYQTIDRLKNKLPETIRKTVGHIEFARPLDNTK
jgi:ribosome-associated translation inhibitor RaiA